MFISQPSRCGARPTWKQGSAASPGIRGGRRSRASSNFGDARDREANEEAVRADQEVRTAPRVSIPGLSTLQPWFSRAKRVWSASVDRTSTVGPAPEMTAG